MTKKPRREEGLVMLDERDVERIAEALCSLSEVIWGTIDRRTLTVVRSRDVSGQSSRVRGLVAKHEHAPLDDLL